MCTPSQIDQSFGCPGWRDLGYCEQASVYYHFMQANCYQSCNNCEGKKIQTTVNQKRMKGNTLNTHTGLIPKVILLKWSFSLAIVASVTRNNAETAVINMIIKRIFWKTEKPCYIFLLDVSYVSIPTMRFIVMFITAVCVLSLVNSSQSFIDHYSRFRISPRALKKRPILWRIFFSRGQPKLLHTYFIPSSTNIHATHVTW